jgi:signal transduction histidine kinase
VIPETTARLLKALPEPSVLVSVSGDIASINRAAAELLGPGAAPGLNLADCAVDPAALRRYLALCGSTTSLLPGAFQLRNGGGHVQRCRCDGALVEPGADGLVLIRIRRGEAASRQFLVLNEKVGALNAEISERRRAQELLQQQATELEQLAVELEQTVEELQLQSETAVQAQAEAEHAAARLTTLAEAGAVLSGTLDYHATLKQLADVAVQTVADYCITYLVDAEGALRRVGGAHTDTAKAPLVERLVREYPTVSAANTGVASVLDSGQPLVASDITDEMLRAAAVDEAQLEILRQLAPNSTVVAPLVAQNRVIGAITLARGVESEPYSSEDVQMVEELARRAALAVDNARLFDEAQRANRAKSAFLATMSHELRTPLNAVVGYADLLDAETSGPLVEAQRAQLSRIRGAAQHLHQIIEEILIFARIEAGKEQVRAAPVSLSKMLHEAADLMAPAAAEKGLSLQLRVDDAPDIATDGAKLRQILLNLLSNAVKFTEHGAISLGVTTFDDGVGISVADTGIGMEAKDVERIFDPFWQVDHGPARLAAGTGLGLTVTQRLARLLGGDIDVASRPGGGSVFTVRLPVSIEAQPEGVTPPRSA